MFAYVALEFCPRGKEVWCFCLVIFYLQSVRSNDHIVTVKMPFPVRETSSEVTDIPEYLHRESLCVGRKGQRDGVKVIHRVLKAQASPDLLYYLTLPPCA